MPFAISDFLLLNDSNRVSKKAPFDGLNHDASLLAGWWLAFAKLCLWFFRRDDISSFTERILEILSYYFPVCGVEVDLGINAGFWKVFK